MELRKRRVDNIEGNGFSASVLTFGLLLWTAIGIYLSLLPDAPGSVFGGEYGHVLIAAILSFGTVIRFPRATRGHGRYLLAGGAIAGLFIEAVQSMGRVGRSFELIDIVADVIGIALGCLVASLFGHLFRRQAKDLGLAVLMGSALLAMSGPVAASAPVQRWIDCRSARQSQAAVTRTLSEVSKGTPFKVASVNVATAFGLGRSTDPMPKDLIREIRCRESFSVEVVATPENVEQSGPRRLLSVSEGTTPQAQQLVIGISTTDLVVRLRFRRDSFEEYRVPQVFRARAELRLRVTYVQGVLRVSVNGKERFRARPHGATLANWDPAMPLNVGNEASDDRQFIGLIRNVKITPGPVPTR